jgi:hypothetical protein
MLVVVLAVAGLQLGLANGEPDCRSTSEAPAIVLSGGDCVQCASRSPAAALATRRAPAVRSGAKWITRLIQNGLERSPTFLRLARAIEKHRALVYVEPRSVLRSRLLGGVPRLIIQAPDGTRYARVWVLQYRPPDDIIKTIGHELQHVVELLEGEEARDHESTTGFRIIETEAAQDVAEAIHRELQGLVGPVSPGGPATTCGR